MNNLENKINCTPTWVLQRVFGSVTRSTVLRPTVVQEQHPDGDHAQPPSFSS